MATAVKNETKVEPRGLKLPTLEEMQERFRWLKTQIDEVESVSTPIRVERDKLVNAQQDKIAALEKQYHDIEKNLAAWKREMGDIVRLTNGNTGLPEADRLVKEAEEAEVAAKAAKEEEAAAAAKRAAEITAEKASES